MSRSNQAAPADASASVVLSLPPNWHPWLRSLYPELDGPYRLSPGTAQRTENRPTEWSVDGSTLRVTAYGDDFFHRLQDEYPEATTLILPAHDDYTGVAAELVEVLGWAFWELRLGGAGADVSAELVLRRDAPLSDDPSEDERLFEIRSSERERVGLLKERFQRAHSEVALGPSEAVVGTGADPEELRSRWTRELRERELTPREVFVGAERFWRWHMLGSLVPVFMARDRFRQWREATVRVGEAVQAAVERLGEDPSLRQHLLGSTQEISVEAPLLCRWDGAQTDRGIQFFELNVGVVGLSDVDMAVAIYRELGLGGDGYGQPCPVFSQLSNFLKAEFRRRFPDADRPTLCVPYSPGMATSFATALLTFTAGLRAGGWEARFALLDSLRFDGTTLTFADGTPINLVARAFFPGAPGAEMVAEAERAGAVFLVNRPAVHGSKSLFELLDDPAIPWTRIVCARRTSAPSGEEVDLLEYALSRQQDLVLKPSDGYGGRAVLLGWTTEPAVWAQAVAQAAGEYDEGRRSILQLGSKMPQADFVDRTLQDVSMYWDVNSYLFGGQFGGVMSRLSGAALTNVSLGGGAAPIYVA